MVDVAAEAETPMISLAASARIIDPTNPNAVDPASRREILRNDHPQFNHNSGEIVFGPDGYLYFGTGDGGGTPDGESAGDAGRDLGVKPDDDDPGRDHNAKAFTTIFEYGVPGTGCTSVGDWEMTCRISDR